MANMILRLDADDVWSAVEIIDTVALLAEELIGRTIGCLDGQDPAGRLEPWSQDEYLLFDGESAGWCALPAASLRTAQSAALAALATRELLVPGGVTVAMLGALAATQPQLAVLARHVPDIVHVAVRLTDAAGAKAFEPRLVDQLDLSGIGLTVVPTLAESLFGANLVIVADDGAMAEGFATARFGHLVHGALVVNASGQDLPTALVDHVDQIYVDDLALLPDHTDRLVVARHLTRSAEAGPAHPPVIAGDLGQLLSSARQGRERDDDVVLVELLRVHTPNVLLAQHIAEAGRRSGFGTRVQYEHPQPP